MSIPLSARLRFQLNKRREKQIRRKYGTLYSEVSRLLFAADPMGINFDDNTDEYDPEVGTILPRLKDCASAADVQSVLHQEFTQWFSPADAGTIETYAAVADQVWLAWNRYLASVHSQ